MVEKDHQGGLVFSVDHARHFAGATRCPSGPLAAFRTRRRLQFLDGRHSESLCLANGKGGISRRLRTRQASRGAGGRERAGYSGGWRKGQEKAAPAVAA